METAGYVALSSQMVLQHQMDVVANNIANINTPAYKAEELMFVEYVTETETGEVSYVQDLATVRDLAHGPLAPTHNPLDLALPDEGYFVVETADGERYTRAGNFTLNEAGELVTAGGNRVLDDGGAPIAIPPEAISITVGRDGTISTEQGQLGRVQVVRFDNEQALLRRENNLYGPNQEVPLPVDDPQVVQGMVEGSNVMGVVEMTRLIGTLRSYQAAQTLVQEESQAQEDAIQGLVDTNA